MASTALRAALFALGLSAPILACTSSEEEAKEAAAKREREAQQAFTKTYCEIVVTCCNRVLELPKDVPGCQARVAQVDPIAVGKEEARTACLTQLRASTPIPEFCPDFGNMEQPACPDPQRKGLTGTKKPGEKCAADAECAPSFEGVVACNGECQLTKRGKEGDGPCTVTVNGDAIEPIAEASGPEVYVCFTRDGLGCDPAAKKCAKPLAERKACTDSRQCGPTLYCDDAEKMCFPRKATGKQCTLVDECEGFCELEGEDIGVCVDAPAEGESCDAKIRCGAGLACTGGKCAQPPADARLAAVCTD